MIKNYRTRLVADLEDIGRAQWDALLAGDPDANSFLRFDFLQALHASGAASAASGWTPRYLTLWQGGALAGAVPLYEKTHSYGEYVFDWAWAEAYQRYGLAYYPKWLAAVPFTPVEGSRLIARDSRARERLADELLAHARASGDSSLHVLLAPAAQIELLARRGMLVRHGVQFHWRNSGYASFDAFLGALAQPKRKKIRAERRKVADAGVVLERRVGAAITERDWSFFFRCYQATYAAHFSSPYLNLDFFQRLGARLPEHVVMVLASRAGRKIGASLAVFDERGLRGRYWGCLDDVPCLHFECCYYQMIEFAIERRLPVFEGGAQGAHKLARGLDPVTTMSAHWLAPPAMHDAVARFLARETSAIAEAADELAEHRAYRQFRAASDSSPSL